MGKDQCPCCAGDKIVTGSCFGSGGADLAIRFVPDDLGWWEAVKHAFASGGVSLGNHKFRLCSECGHLWMTVQIGNSKWSNT